MQKPVIPYGRQEITDADLAAVAEVLKSDFLTQGPMVEQFEKAFAQYVGAPYAVAVNNGTTALHIASVAGGIQKGDRVLCTSNSFVASSNGTLYAGGDVDFVDIDEKNFCIDLNQVESALKKNNGSIKGVVAVDFAGYPIVREELRELTRRHNVFLVEDACHAVGAEYQSRDKKTWLKSGSGQHADMSIFSFHPVKHLTTGEGGLITTSDEKLYKKLCLLRTHGITKNPQEMTQVHGGWYYEMQELGFNYRISDILCALGLSQLKRMQKNIDRRQEIAQKYNRDLAGLPLTWQHTDPSLKNAFHLYVIQTDRRLELYNFLKEKNIHAQVHYIPIHQQPYYVKRYGPQSLPKTEAYYKRSLSLPMYHGMTNEQQERVIETIKEFFKS